MREIDSELLGAAVANPTDIQCSETTFLSNEKTFSQVFLKDIRRGRENTRSPGHGPDRFQFNREPLTQASLLMDVTLLAAGVGIKSAKAPSVA
jgi:hypothetical protein